jgi:hypothetical protein
MLVAAGRRAPVDAELEDLVDDDVILDSSPLKPRIDRSAAQPEAVDHSRACCESISAAGFIVDV